MEKQGEARGGGGEYGKLSAPSASSLKLFLSQPVMTILSYRPHEGSFTFFIETPLNFTSQGSRSRKKFSQLLKDMTNDLECKIQIIVIGILTFLMRSKVRFLV